MVFPSPSRWADCSKLKLAITQLPRTRRRNQLEKVKPSLPSLSSSNRYLLPLCSLSSLRFPPPHSLFNPLASLAMKSVAAVVALSSLALVAAAPNPRSAISKRAPTPSNYTYVYLPISEKDELGLEVAEGRRRASELVPRSRQLTSRLFFFSSAMPTSSNTLSLWSTSSPLSTVKLWEPMGRLESSAALTSPLPVSRVGPRSSISSSPSSRNC